MWQNNIMLTLTVCVLLPSCSSPDSGDSSISGKNDYVSTSNSKDQLGSNGESRAGSTCEHVSDVLHVGMNADELRQVLESLEFSLVRYSNSGVSLTRYYSSSIEAGAELIVSLRRDSEFQYRVTKWSCDAR